MREAAWNALSPEAREETHFLLKYDYDDAGLMTTRFLAVRPNQKVAQALRWVHRNLGKVETVHSLYVVDRGNRLLGIVTFDDVLDVIREQQGEDAYKMSAVSASRETYLESSVPALV